jgi:enamine deaminase RidA (YjgF/YER057c/UK114 family)
MSYEARLHALGIELPDWGGSYYGATYGSMKPFHIVGDVLYLSGHIPQLPDGTVVHPGKLGRDVTIEQGYQAARICGLNCLAWIREALGSLDRVGGIVRSLNFVACVESFTEPNLVSSGATDLFAEVLGREAGLGGRATIGVMSLAANACFENWLTVEIRSPARRARRAPERNRRPGPA